MPKLTIASTEPSSEWSALGNDTTNLTWTPVRLQGRSGLRFDKADGAANTKLACVYREVASVNIERSFDPHDVAVWPMIVPDLTNVEYAFLRIGSDASNYIELRYADTSLTAARWCLCRAALGEAYVAGSGADLSAVEYVAVGVAFDGEANTLANIVAGSPYMAGKALSD